MWRTIMSAYRGAPFFEHYATDLQALLNEKFTFVYDLNMAALSFCVKSLRWRKSITETNFYSQAEPGSTDARSLIESRKTFSQRGIYKAHTYYQVFGSKFSENLSLMDLLFCKGPDSDEILAASKGNRLND